MSFFTRYLVEGLKTGKADTDNDGFIDVDEWFKYAYYRVRETNPYQKPGKDAAKVGGQILIARNPYWTSPSERPSSDKKELSTKRADISKPDQVLQSHKALSEEQQGNASLKQSQKEETPPTTTENRGLFIGGMVIGILLIVLGLFLCPLVNISTLQTAYAFYNTATEATQGTVQTAEETFPVCGAEGVCSSPDCSTTVTFTPPNQTNIFTVFVHQCLYKGEKVEVLYNRNDPHIAKTASEALGEVTGNILLIIVWPLLALWGLFFFLRWLSRKE